MNIIPILTIGKYSDDVRVNRYMSHIKTLDDHVTKFAKYISPSVVLIVVGLSSNAFGEHGKWGCKENTFEECFNVPMYIYGGDESFIKLFDNVESLVDFNRGVSGLLDENAHSALFSVFEGGIVHLKYGVKSAYWHDGRFDSALVQNGVDGEKLVLNEDVKLIREEIKEFQRDVAALYKYQDPADEDDEL